MSVLSYDDLLGEDGVRVDPYKLAALARALLSASSGAAVNALQVKSTTGLLFGFVASSSLGAAQFIQLHDVSSTASEGRVPEVVFNIGATSALPIQYIPPRAFRNGIFICNSTTQNTKTIGAANTVFDVQYL